MEATDINRYRTGINRINQPSLFFFDFSNQPKIASRVAACDT
jgi:hypothetical protein